MIPGLTMGSVAAESITDVEAAKRSGNFDQNYCQIPRDLYEKGNKGV